jgi:hypothetical protein
MFAHLVLPLVLLLKYSILEIRRILGTSIYIFATFETSSDLEDEDACYDTLHLLDDRECYDSLNFLEYAEMAKSDTDDPQARSRPLILIDDDTTNSFDHALNIEDIKPYYGSLDTLERGRTDLLTLPVELIVLIARQLPAHSLVSLARTNRHFHAVINNATHILYDPIIAYHKDRLRKGIAFMDLEDLPIDVAMRHFATCFERPWSWIWRGEDGVETHYAKPNRTFCKAYYQANYDKLGPLGYVGITKMVQDLANISNSIEFYRAEELRYGLRSEWMETAMVRTLFIVMQVFATIDPAPSAINAALTVFVRGTCTCAAC